MPCVTHYGCSLSIAEVAAGARPAAASRAVLHAPVEDSGGRLPKPISITACAPSASISLEELEKIVDACRSPETGEPARDLRLCVRLRVSSEYSELSLASKYRLRPCRSGPRCCSRPPALRLAGRVLPRRQSGAMTPFAFVQAMDRPTRAAIAEASVCDRHDRRGRGLSQRLSRPRTWPTALEDYFRDHSRTPFRWPPLSDSPTYAGELVVPNAGRALSPEITSLRLVGAGEQSRPRGEELYINDGAFRARCMMLPSSHGRFPGEGAGKDDLIREDDADFRLPYGPDLRNDAD